MKFALLAWLSVCALFLLLFTGCSGDDQPNNTSAQNIGTNRNNQTYLCDAPFSFFPNAMTLTPADGSGPVRVEVDAAGNYVLHLQPNAETETGAAEFTPDGDRATLVLIPNSGGVTRIVNFVMNSSTQGTYTSDSLGQGTFTLDFPLSSGCGPY